MSSVTTTTATLHGELLDVGESSSVDVWFDWGLSGGDPGFRTPVQTRTSTGFFSAEIDHLIPDTAYHFRAVSDTGSVITTGRVAEFVTREEELLQP